MIGSKKVVKRRQSTSSFKAMISGFFFIILIGAVLLSMPFSSRSGKFTNFSDALFTAVSSTCVTGLIVVDTSTYWSVIGQFIILLLIQTGGMGVITVSLAIIAITGKKIGFKQRTALKDSISASQVGGIIKFTRFIVKTVLVIELSGAVLLAPVFIHDYGFLKGVWFAVFHSVSAFCNAGFDLLGFREKFSSLTTYQNNYYINIVLMLLIIVGGISFMTWRDFKEKGFHFSKFTLQTKIILSTSVVLIFVPAIFFFFAEYYTCPFGERTLYSLFQSVTTRTAGFNTTDLSAMGDAGKLLMVILMLIGGSPGSTAGGLKTTTIAVLFMSAKTVFKRRRDVTCFNRRIADETVRNAGAVLFIYLCLFIGSGMIISIVEELPLITCLFETGSAIGTVGLTLGVTPTLCPASRIILMLLMFFGRMGGLTMIYAALPSNAGETSRSPLEKVSVG